MCGRRRRAASSRVRFSAAVRLDDGRCILRAVSRELPRRGGIGQPKRKTLANALSSSTGHLQAAVLCVRRLARSAARSPAMKLARRLALAPGGRRLRGRPFQSSPATTPADARPPLADIATENWSAATLRARTHLDHRRLPVRNRSRGQQPSSTSPSPHGGKALIGAYGLSPLRQAGRHEMSHRRSSTPEFVKSFSTQLKPKNAKFPETLQLSQR